MDIKKINELMEESSWTAMLAELPVGKHTIQFKSVDAIRSCKARAYDINSDHIGRRYAFSVNKAELSAVINVEDE